MTKTYKIKVNLLTVLIPLLLLVLNGCSSSYRDIQSGAIPNIPEIRSTERLVRSTKKAKPKSYTARVKKYSITSTTSTVVTQKALTTEAKQRSVVEVDPYASIPENSSIKATSPVPAPPSKMISSPAVSSLMARAKADLAIGRSQSAVSKLERGLRIESQNPKIWNLLAKAHFDQKNYQQTISMAKKSIRYATEDQLISQNWKLIKIAGDKSDNAIAIKEALDYFKVNP